MEVAAAGKGFHLWWPGTILWLINSETDCAKCSPWAQVLTSSREIPQRSLLQEKNCNRLDDRCKLAKVRQLSGGIGGCDFNCFLNNCHGNVEGATSRGFRPLQQEQRCHIIHVRGPDGLLKIWWFRFFMIKKKPPRCTNKWPNTAGMITRSGEWYLASDAYGHKS